MQPKATFTLLKHFGSNLILYGQKSKGRMKSVVTQMNIYRKGLFSYKTYLGSINAEIQSLPNPNKVERISAVENQPQENHDI